MLLARIRPNGLWGFVGAILWGLPCFLLLTATVHRYTKRKKNYEKKNMGTSTMNRNHSNFQSAYARCEQMWVVYNDGQIYVNKNRKQKERERWGKFFLLLLLFKKKNFLKFLNLNQCQIVKGGFFLLSILQFLFSIWCWYLETFCSTNLRVSSRVEAKIRFGVLPSLDR